MAECFLNERVVLHCGDCLDVLATLAENSLDACVTDPPYHLTSIVQRFGAEDAALPRFKTGAYGGGFKEANGGTGAAFARMSRGFMGKQWDGGDIAFRPETWAAVYRVLKPGAHLVAMGGTRTYHRMACAIEDAGFEIRDTVSWLYGSGFPKSHDVSKGIDRAAEAERDVVGQRKKLESYGPNEIYGDGPDHNGIQLITAPATDAAREWAGWGTALKPACELIALCRKPLSQGTVAANVLRWGTGAININGCRVGFANDADEAESKIKNQHEDFGSALRHNKIYGKDERAQVNYNPTGRWPANLCHDGSDEVVAAFPETNPSPDGPVRQGGHHRHDVGLSGDTRNGFGVGYGDSGSAARFFYTSKADANERLGSKHPTVKPLDLMQWLVRLVTPPRGSVLDPFAGTGTTGEAAWREGMRAVLIEADAIYQDDIRRRMALALAGPDERGRESIKAKGLPYDPGPLFSGIAEAAE